MTSTRALFRVSAAALGSALACRVSLCSPADTPPPLISVVERAAASLRGPVPFSYPRARPDGKGATVVHLPQRGDVPPATLTLAPPVRPLPSATGDVRRDMEALVRSVQDEVCDALTAVEGVGGGTFREDVWTRPEGGGGRTRVLQGGRVFQKAGVGVSVVHGTLPPAAVAQMRARLGGSGPLRVVTTSGDGALPPLPFFACGVSLVIHPVHPFAPTAHANYRYFEVLVPDNAAPGGSRVVWWFGGGADLTPSYAFPEDATHFHSALAAACDRAHPTAYSRFKAWADVYFALPHRDGERRGVGGIFFDDLDGPAALATLVPPGGERSEGMGGGGDASTPPPSPLSLLPFIADAARSFLPAYVPIVAARCIGAYDPARHGTWQQLRRGRYVEFNLVHDRGTKFGLATPGARIESVLMSLPLTARWEYGNTPEAGSPEEALVALLRDPLEWVPTK